MERKVRNTLVVAVTGGRDYTDKKLVWRQLNLIRAECHYLELVNGGCPTGVDLFAREWYDRERSTGGWCTLITVKADWRKYRRAAGPIRNREMLVEYDVQILLAFPGGRGTASCTRIARELSIEVREYA